MSAKVANPTRWVFCLLAVAAGLAHPPPAEGASQAARENPLAAVTGLRCRFTLTTSVLWKDGKPDVRITATNSQVTISEIDTQDGTAEVTGPQERRFASAVLSDGTLYFVETRRGAVDVTTVFATESTPGKLKAVRAEHAYVFLIVPPFVPDPTVAQSYGECEATGR